MTPGVEEKNKAQRRSGRFNISCMTPRCPLVSRLDFRPGSLHPPFYPPLTHMPPVVYTETEVFIL